MRDKYALDLIFRALKAWDDHKVEWLKRLSNARQPQPSDEQVDSYRNIWIEGYLEAMSDANQKQDTESQSATD